LNWWNTGTNQLEQAVIPEQTLQVKPAQGNNQGSSKPLAVDHSSTNASTATDAKPATANGLWQLSTALFAAAWLITLMLWWRRRPLTAAPAVAEVGYGSEKSTYKSLKKVCDGNDISQLRPALLAWGQSRWPQQPLNSLADLIRFAPALDTSISALNSQQYGLDTDKSLRGASLLEAVQQIRDRAGDAPTQPDLAPLYS
jgi:hypothetical protein